MPKPKYKIHVTANSVDAVIEGISAIWFGCLFIAIGVGWAYLRLIHPGRGPAIQQILVELRPGRHDFVSNLAALIFCTLFELFFLVVGVRHLLPFGERLQADRSNLTWSKIPWLSFGNRWVTKSTPMAEIFQASYVLVYESKNIHGIVLETYGESWKMFWGIESPEANRILRGLKALGVNVHHDPEMREVVRETLRDRRAEL